MKKKQPVNKKSIAYGCALVITLNLLPLMAHAKIYIYIGPGGDQIVSDRPLQRKGYRMQHARQDVSDVGDILAGRTEENAAKRRQFYDSYIQDASKKLNLDPALVKAVIHVESDFNPAAISHKGARGLMQLMPQTAARYHQRDLFSPLANIDAGTQHLSYLMQRYDQNMPLVLAAYNAGEHNVDRYHGIPPFQETRQYVKKVMKYQERYSNLTLATNL